MRYIRTKDGIYEYEKVKTRVFVQKGFYSEEKTLSEEESLRLFPYEIIKQADTIEELCDMFIAFDTNSNNHKIYACLVNAIEDYHFDIIFGAIWTDKGLIYVAKMNEKGVLELI